jgi:hypothetical protein
LDSAGNIYIADAGNNVIRVVNTQGSPITIAGVTIPASDISTVAGNGTLGHGGDGGAATSAQLNLPNCVALDSAGNIYIADDDNNLIRVVNTQSTSITIAGVTIPAGDISTVAGSYAAGGSYSGDGGAATSAGLNHPTGVALDSAGDIYIADEANNIIRVVNTQSSSVTIAGVTIPAGAINTVAGNNAAGGGYSGDGFQATSAKLLNPLGLALDSAGNIYVADSANNVIRKVSAASGVISTVAGNNALPAGYSGDNGPPTSAELNGPSGVVVDNAGNYYIADFANNVIRKLAP